MVELEACGRKFRIRKIDSLNLVVDEFRAPKKPNGEEAEPKWIPFSNYFQRFRDAQDFILDRVKFDAVGNDDVVLTMDEFWEYLDRGYQL